MPPYEKGTNRTGRPWQRLKGRVLRASTICHLCGKPGADSADHIVPVSLGGPVYDINNLAAVHQRCNIIRGNKSVEEARKIIAEKGEAAAGHCRYHDFCPDGPHSRRWSGDDLDDVPIR